MARLQPRPSSSRSTSLLLVLDIWLMRRYATRRPARARPRRRRRCPRCRRSVTDDGSRRCSGSASSPFFLAATSCSRASTSASACCCRSCRATRSERSAMFRSIGPVWDGNEVWLVVAGGAMFAAFPAWYATMFSGFYIALLLRARLPDHPRALVRVARRRHEGPRWRGVWTWANTIGSFGAVADLGRRRSRPCSTASPINSNGDFAGSFWDLFNVYTLLGGVAVVLLFAFHGATYLTLRTTGELCRRAARGGPAALDRRRRRRRRLPDLDGRRRGRPERQGRLPAAAAGRCSAIAALVARGRLRTGRPQRLGVRADRRRRVPRRGDDLHEPLPARDGVEHELLATASPSTAPRRRTTRWR